MGIRQNVLDVAEIRDQSIRDARDKQAHDELKARGAVLEGHFVTHNSSFHSKWYYHMRPLFMTSSLWSLLEDLTASIPETVLEQITVVCGAQSRGDVMATIMANLISARHPKAVNVRAVPIERNFKAVVRDLKRVAKSINPYYRETLKGAGVLFVDDVLATGKTSNAGIALVDNFGGKVVATASFVDYRLTKNERPHFACWTVPTSDIYPVADCPMCRERMAITEF